MIEPRPEVLMTPHAVHGGRLALPATAGGAEELNDFSVCLNAFGPAPSVLGAVRACRIDEYPDPQSRAPRHAAAARWRRPVAEIMLGAGAAELLQAVCLTYLRPGDAVLIAGPAFGEYARAAMLCGAHTHTTDGLDAAASAGQLVREITRIRPRLVFLATPANPSGDAMPLGDLRRIADASRDADALLVLDQAYDGFMATPLGTPALPGHPAVLHLRSITKDHALAGIRVAFAVAPADVAHAIERARVPWTASAVAQAAATAAMGDDAIAYVAETTAALRAEADRIRAALATAPVVIHPSATHFMLVHCGPERRVRDQLLSQSDLLVRDCASFGLPGSIRIAARTPPENDVLLAALRRMLA